jgi:hypothetical protein
MAPPLPTETVTALETVLDVTGLNDRLTPAQRTALQEEFAHHLAAHPELSAGELARYLMRSAASVGPQNIRAPYAFLCHAISTASTLGIATTEGEH